MADGRLGKKQAHLCCRQNLKQDRRRRPVPTFPLIGSQLSANWTYADRDPLPRRGKSSPAAALT
jgi:hypothetical protein